MAKAPKIYRRLPGRGASLIGYYRLYLGPDHLLLVSFSGYSESYKRFYFRDIQSIVLQRTVQWKVFNWIFGSMTALGAAAWTFEIMSGFSSNGGIVFLECLWSILSVVPLFFNLLGGPTCECQVRTAVQVERIPSLKRLRNARKVLHQIKPLMDAAQGQLSPEELAGGASDVAFGDLSDGIAAPPVIGAMRPAAPAAPLTSYGGEMHWMLVWLLLADLPTTVLAMYFRNPWTHILNVIVNASACIVAILAIVRQRGADFPTGLKRLPWVVIVASGFSFASSQIHSTIISIQGMGGLKYDADHDPVSLTLAVVTTTISVVLAGYCIIRLWPLRAKKTTPVPPLQPPPAPTPPPAQP